jgi:hypothetical protein
MGLKTPTASYSRLHTKNVLHTKIREHDRVGPKSVSKMQKIYAKEKEKNRQQNTMDTDCNYNAG